MKSKISLKTIETCHYIWYYVNMKGDEKIIKKFINDKMHITVEDCDRLLTLYGYELRKSGGSHKAYHKKGDAPITIVTPKNKKFVKPSYVNLIIKRLNLEE